MSKHMSTKPPHQPSELVSALAKTRRELGLSQQELGARLGLPQSHVSLIERGKVDLRLSSLIEMARVLELEVALVPRRVVPALRSLVDARAGDEGFLYRLGGETGDDRPATDE